MKYILIIVVFLLAGCISPQRIDPIYHPNACGPQSLHSFLKAHNINVSPRDISFQMQSNHKEYNTFRQIGGLFNYHAHQISFPEEIINIMQSYGFEVNVYLGDDESLRILLEHWPDISGIALSQNVSTLKMHYEAFPPIENVGSLYGDKNSIIMLFVVKDE